MMHIPHIPVSLLLALLVLGAVLVPLAARAIARCRARYWSRLEAAFLRFEPSHSGGTIHATTP
jgi:hypothetical protein